MSSVKHLVALALLLGVGPMWLLPQGGAAPEAKPKLADVVKIEFPKGGYTFTLAEAARGVKPKYKIIVTKDVEGVIAQGTLPSRDKPGPSGLRPLERISGKDQLYSLTDF